MTDVNIDTVLEPLQGVLNTLQGSQAARTKYGEELGKKVQEVETALGLLKEITTGVNKLKDDIKDGQDAISAAKAAGDKKVADEIARVKEEAKKDAAEAAKQAGENVTAAKREAIDKIQPLVDAIAAQKENIEGAIGDLNNVGFSDSMDKVVKAINELNKIFNTDSPKPPPHGPSPKKPFSFADAGRAMTTEAGQQAARKQQFKEARSKFEGGGRRRTRRRRRGGFRYGVPKSALPRTLRSVLSLKTKSTRRKSPKKRKGKKSRKKKRRRRR